MAIDKDNQKMLIFLAIVIGIVYAHNAGFFGINIQGSDIRYYNKDIVIPFTLTNFTNPVIESYFNDVQLYEVLVYQVNETMINDSINPATNQSYNTTYQVLVDETINQSIGYTQYSGNGTYNVKFVNIQTEGLLKIKVIEGEHTEVKSIEVRQGYVDISENIPNLVDKSKLWTIEIDTRNPQGDDLEADSVDIDVIDPQNVKTNFILTKSGNTFTKQFSYTEAGNYIFKIHAKKEGYTTKEVTRVTSVAKPEGIHPIVFFWVGAAVLWLLLFGIKMARRFIK